LPGVVKIDIAKSILRNETLLR